MKKNERSWCADIPLEKDRYGLFTYHCERAPVAGLAETNEGVRVYLEPGESAGEWTHRLAEWANCSEDDIKWEKLASRNWNKEWEAHFDAIKIGTFCGIRAPFHAPFGEAVDYEIVIQPEMAFGTGHHETTAMMIESMQNLSWRGRDVLDWGSGTGILAILAKKMGANRVKALEIDENAWRNARENMERNNVEVEIKNTGLDDLEERDFFDVILANINRNVLLNGREDLLEHAKQGSTIILSGIQRRDIPSVQKAYLTHWDQAVEMHFKGNWVCLSFEWTGD